MRSANNRPPPLSTVIRPSVRPSFSQSVPAGFKWRKFNVRRLEDLMARANVKDNLNRKCDIRLGLINEEINYYASHQPQGSRI